MSSLSDLPPFDTLPPLELPPVKKEHAGVKSETKTKPKPKLKTATITKRQVTDDTPTTTTTKSKTKQKPATIQEELVHGGNTFPWDESKDDKGLADTTAEAVAGTEEEEDGDCKKPPQNAEDEAVRTRIKNMKGKEFKLERKAIHEDPQVIKQAKWNFENKLLPYMFEKESHQKVCLLVGTCGIGKSVVASAIAQYGVMAGVYSCVIVVSATAYSIGGDWEWVPKEYRLPQTQKTIDQLVAWLQGLQKQYHGKKDHPHICLVLDDSSASSINPNSESYRTLISTHRHLFCSILLACQYPKSRASGPTLRKVSKCICVFPSQMKMEQESVYQLVGGFETFEEFREHFLGVTQNARYCFMTFIADQLVAKEDNFFATRCPLPDPNFTFHAPSTMDRASKPQNPNEPAPVPPPPVNTGNNNNNIKPGLLGGNSIYAEDWVKRLGDL